MGPRHPRTILVATILFFCSGMLGLGYELVWIRKAALIVGASQIALSTVLTAFFLGLGAGSYFVGQHLKERSRSPLFVYGLFEVAIGLFALAFPWLFRLVEAVYGSLYPMLESSSAAVFALRFSLLFVLFLTPTFFMGGTLPLLLDGLVDRDAAIGARVSFLYGLNILGAVAGVLLTSYFAIPGLGMDGTSRVFGLGNLAIGVAALAAFRSLRPVHAEPVRASVEPFFLAAAFVSGLLAIAYQVAWARYFSLFNTGTVYLTAILLAVYLLALAAGSFGLAPLLALRTNPLSALSAVQGLLPLAAIGLLEAWRGAEWRYSLLGRQLPDGSYGPIDTLEIATRSTRPAYPHHWQFANETLDAIFFAPLFQVALVIFVPVALLGVGLPAILAAASSTASGLRSATGRVLLWNTVGSSAGGFVAGYVLLPLLGLHFTLLALSVGSIGLAVAAWRRARGSLRGLAFPALGIAGTLLLAFRDDMTTSTIQFHGYGRDPEVGNNPDTNPPKRGSIPLTEVVEGPLTTSFLFENQESVRIGSGNVCLAVVYKGQPCSQAIQGHVPALFYPGAGAPQDCLGICLGSGQSFGALLLYPIRKLDVVDISSEIVQLSLRRFEPYNHGLKSDPRVKVHLDDGRHFVSRAPDASYDVVSMEPPPPTAEGVFSLYSLEFYEEARRILRDGGLFMQWLPLYRISPLDTKGIIKTQAAVFPETFVVKVFKDDFMVVSYKTRPRFPLDAIRERVRIFETERLLQRASWNASCRHAIASLEGVLAFLVMGPEEIRAMDAPMIYHDDDQILSYSSGDRWLLRRYEGPALSALSFAALRMSPFENLKGYFEPPLSPELVEDLTTERAAALELFKVPDPRKVEAAKQALRSSQDPVERLQLALGLAAAHDAMLSKEEAFQFVDDAVAASKSAPVTDEQTQIVKAIVRHAIVAYEALTAKWIALLATRNGASALIQGMSEELAAFRRREAERKAKYWLR